MIGVDWPKGVLPRRVLCLYADSAIELALKAEECQEVNAC
jgi:hypothetical protein